MKPFRVPVIILLLAAGSLLAQDYAPPPAKAPDKDTLQAIADKTRRLGQAVESLRRQGVPDQLLVEAQVYHKAATWIVRHNEFYQAADGAKTLDVLDRGLLRASQLGQGQTPWLQQSGLVVARAYRSRIDGSVQPYAVSYPVDYGKVPGKKYRLDVELHGRDSSLTEVKFLTQYSGDKPAPKGQPYVHLQVFGRGNNAYRWAGEGDVLEALDAFVATERFLGRADLLDADRVVLRGFSMGGAGTWHLGLHKPDQWCVLGPGAGFTTTHGYVKNLPEKLPPYQEACLHIYDAADYAQNAFNVPVVAYSGDQDPQMQAARNIEARLKPLGIPMTHLVAPGLAHRFPPEWKQKAEAEYARYAAKGRDEHPTRIRFVTYTLKYPKCYWVQLLGLDRHYERAAVEAERTEAVVTIKTANVRTLRLAATAATPLTVKIDGQEIEAKPWLSQDGTLQVCLDRSGDGPWRIVLPPRLLTVRVRRPQKVPSLQGPIDDAFTNSFLCVRGTGRPWNEGVQKYVEADLERFREEWSKFFRGDLPVKDDADVTEEDIAGKSLVLFGDPGSNALIAGALDGLPLKWTKERLEVAGQEYPAGHVPALIYPSPLNPGRYVVLNSGHTFHAAELRGTNALLFPRLGDYAVLKPTAEGGAAEVVTAGLFDEYWQIPK
jgi:dienelactone hydrolase